MADQATFEDDAMEFVPQLYSAALRMTRNPADAEDVVQETFLKVYSARQRYEPNARFQSWLLRIASNVCLSRLRRKSPVALGTTDAEGEHTVEPVDHKSSQPKDILLKGELKHRIQQAVAQLPEFQLIH